jgi:hypothetical protein
MFVVTLLPLYLTGDDEPWIIHCIYWICNYYCCCSGITICWVTFNPVDGLASHNWYDAVRTTWCTATVTIPLASMLNGPVVNGVTLVLVVVARLA